MRSISTSLLAAVAACLLSGCGEPNCLEACMNIMWCKEQKYDDQTLRDIRDEKDCMSRCAIPEANRGIAAWRCADSESDCSALDSRCDVY